MVVDYYNIITTETLQYFFQEDTWKCSQFTQRNTVTRRKNTVTEHMETINNFQIPREQCLIDNIFLMARKIPSLQQNIDI